MNLFRQTLLITELRLIGIPMTNHSQFGLAGSYSVGIAAAMTAYVAVVAITQAVTNSGTATP